MSIASGYKKFKKYILTSSGFQLVSHWTKANTLEFDDGKTAQDKLGAIDGISSSRESNSDKIAASTALVSELNSDLAGYKFGTTSDGKPGYIVPGGADTVIPFNRVINVTGEVMGNRVTISLGFHPDLLYVEFGSQYEVKRLYSIYSGDVDSVIVNNDGFTCNFNAGGTDTPCKYRAVKFT
ncbi:hypothetical protein [Eisenbergiella tayi]|uniref:Uncharacterized protein n=1 Tax=Eisenbergiella tayi TaxID=1432052 RepID=A0A1E3A6Z3_9FIRM|nr:hypothetical protein [Eisenbergiella tayi]ODM03986.1 hypothetical protein BEI61_04789 [Eisenbergiella tayi]